MTKNNTFLQKQLPIKDNSIPLQQILAPIVMKFIAIDSVLEKYPFIKTEMGWTKSDIKALFESHLILGEIKNKKIYLSPESLEKLIDYHRKVNNQ
tara:strand:+ start:331 stop:615 length:285 start_codon:yes stop_codon:yes gene_type:complete